MSPKSPEHPLARGITSPLNLQFNVNTLRGWSEDIGPVAAKHLFTTKLRLDVRYVYHTRGESVPFNGSGSLERIVYSKSRIASTWVT
jgi:hypothetical protein